jgi:hypothetical protein
MCHNTGQHLIAEISGAGTNYYKAERWRDPGREGIKAEPERIKMYLFPVKHRK